MPIFSKASKRLCNTQAMTRQMSLLSEFACLRSVILEYADPVVFVCVGACVPFRLCLCSEASEFSEMVLGTFHERSAEG